ncbi:MAG: hypothetical protein KDK51_04675 [Deltaproteobacteria bacterium]|nr:hypothetical protein [Deltaproteobacteria bacterium]
MKKFLLLFLGMCLAIGQDVYAQDSDLDEKNGPFSAELNIIEECHTPELIAQAITLYAKKINVLAPLFEMAVLQLDLHAMLEQSSSKHPSYKSLQSLAADLRMHRQYWQMINQDPMPMQEALSLQKTLQAEDPDCLAGLSWVEYLLLTRTHLSKYAVVAQLSTCLEKLFDPAANNQGTRLESTILFLHRPHPQTHELIQKTYIKRSSIQEKFTVSHIIRALLDIFQISKDMAPNTYSALNQ